LSIVFGALLYIVWKNSLRKFKVVRTPEQKIKRREILPPSPEAKIIVPQFSSDLEITE
jgi:hypothetical protein